MNPSTFSGSFLLSSAAASAGSRQSSTCRIIDILDFFFVAHPDSGRTEGQESRRIFYYNSPKSESLEKQVSLGEVFLFLLVVVSLFFTVNPQFRGGGGTFPEHVRTVNKCQF